MEGRAMFTAELMNGVRNAARVAMMRTIRRWAIAGVVVMKIPVLLLKV
jgi:translation initiation factor IF-1